MEGLLEVENKSLKFPLSNFHLSKNFHFLKNEKNSFIEYMSFDISNKFTLNDFEKKNELLNLIKILDVFKEKNNVLTYNEFLYLFYKKDIITNTERKKFQQLLIRYIKKGIILSLPYNIAIKEKLIEDFLIKKINNVYCLSEKGLKLIRYFFPYAKVNFIDTPKYFFYIPIFFIVNDINILLGKNKKKIKKERIENVLNFSGEIIKYKRYKYVKIALDISFINKYFNNNINITYNIFLNFYKKYSDNFLKENIYFFLKKHNEVPINVFTKYFEKLINTLNKQNK